MTEYVESGYHEEGFVEGDSTSSSVVQNCDLESLENRLADLYDNVQFMLVSHENRFNAIIDSLNSLKVDMSTPLNLFESLNGLYGTLRDGTRVKTVYNDETFVVNGSLLLNDKEGKRHVVYLLTGNNQNMVVTQNQILSEV